MNIENPKNPKLSHILKKTLNLSVVYSKYDHEYKQMLTEKESIEILKLLGVNTNTEEYQKTYHHV